MDKEKLYIYDTTLRDGQQTHGVVFSVKEKLRITKALDELGVDYIEGGWPGANPTDTDYFNNVSFQQSHAKIAAFGMTKREGKSAENDEVLAPVVNSGAQSICLVGKAHDFHVEQALGISLASNLSNIELSLKHLVSLEKEGIFDAEHFFDGFKANKDYALKVIFSALEAGARWVVLCDTNGGTLPHEISKIVTEVIECGFPGKKLGIHTHNDTENAVANSLSAILAGARHIQGTVNGLGERCGNANLISLIPSLLMKEPFKSTFSINIKEKNLSIVTKLSRLVDDILNRVPVRSAPYVGSSAFTHKAGLHASAILKNPKTYEHISPELVGNHRVIPMSNQAGLSNLKKRLFDCGIDFKEDNSKLNEILRIIKEKEDQGYSYDVAGASFELLALKLLNQMPIFFNVKRYRVGVERRKNKYNKSVSLSEAVVVVEIDGKKKLSVSESLDEHGNDRGPVNALAGALAKDLGKYQDIISGMKLIDYKVRITAGGTEAVTRVLIDSEDGEGRRWSTIGISPNIVDASFQALLDAMNWKILKSLEG